MRYFGQVRELYSGCARITVFARLIKDGNRWIRDKSFDISEEIGSTDKVFLRVPIARIGLTDRALVRFDITSNSRPVAGSDKDSHIVASKPDGRGLAIEPFGAFVVDESEANWSNEPRWIKGVPERSIVYVYNSEEDILIGPWRVQYNQSSYFLSPKDTPDLVYRYPRSKINPLSLVQVKEDEATREYVLPDLPQSIAESVDVASGEKQVKWFLEQLPYASNIVAQVIEQLDGQCPNWRNQLINYFTQINDQTKQKIFLSRWKHIDEILQYLVIEQREFEQLRQNSIFQEKWEQAVAPYREQICLQAEQETVEFCAFEQQKREREKEETVMIMNNLKQEIGKQNRKLEEIKEEVVVQNVKLQQEKAQLLEAAEFLRQQQSQLVIEFTAFQTLLSATGQHDTIVETSIPKESAGGKPPAYPIDELTVPIENCDLFINERLFPALLQWLPNVTLRWVELFHYTLLACRALLVPSCAWAIGYQEALGVTSRLQIHEVEPTWLSFADAFNKDFSQFWSEAVQDRHHLYLLVLQDINRSLPECWARPLLNLLAGFRQTLDTAGQYPWPENLRLLLTVATDSASYPLAEQVVRYFAAVPFNRIGKAPAEVPTLYNGYVPLEAWQCWCGPPLASIPTLPAESEVAGPATRLIAGDLLRLQQVLENFGQHDDPAHIARQIRCRWPEDYMKLNRRDDE